jgi:hypothetical protein
MNKDKLLADARDYLAAKYGEKFDILGMIGHCRGLTADRIGAKPSGKPYSYSFTVYAKGDAFYDNYDCVSMKRTYEQALDKFLELEAIPDAHLRRTVTISKNAAHARIVLYDPVFSVSQLQKLARHMAAFHLPCVLSLYNGDTNDAYLLPNAVFCVKSDGGTEQMSPRVRHGGTRLSAEQLERLCCLVYLEDLPDCIDLGNLGMIASYMLAMGFAEEDEDTDESCCMTAKEWQTVLQDIIDSDQLSALMIADYVDITETSSKRTDVLPGHRAVCFADSAHNAYVVFRGTCGDYEWYDNGEGMTQADTTQQLASLDFVRRIRMNTRISPLTLTVAGHSKGGNKAMYAFITDEDTGKNDRCFALDGQGFSTEFQNKYQTAVARKSSRIEGYAERRDFVNCLGIYAARPGYHSGRRGEAAERYPFGQPLPFFHCPDALRTDSDLFGPAAPSAYISLTINKLVAFLLTSPEYASKKRDISLDLMSLMMQSKRADTDEIATALANVALAFIEMIADNEDFDEDILRMTTVESDALAATVMFAFPEDGGDNDDDDSNLAKLTLKKIILGVIFHPKRILQCINAAGKFKQLVNALDPAVPSQAYLRDKLNIFADKISDPKKESHNYGISDAQIAAAGNDDHSPATGSTAAQAAVNTISATAVKIIPIDDHTAQASSPPASDSAANTPPENNAPASTAPAALKNIPEGISIPGGTAAEKAAFLDQLGVIAAFNSDPAADRAASESQTEPQ